MYDEHHQFFREKYRKLNEFEKKFDNKRTLRLSVNRLVRKYELENVLSKYSIVSPKTESN